MRIIAADRQSAWIRYPAGCSRRAYLFLSYYSMAGTGCAPETYSGSVVLGTLPFVLTCACRATRTPSPADRPAGRNCALRPRIRAHGFHFRASTSDDVVYQTRHRHSGAGNLCAAGHGVYFRVFGLPHAFARTESLGHQPAKFPRPPRRAQFHGKRGGPARRLVFPRTEIRTYHYFVPGVRIQPRRAPHAGLGIAGSAIQRIGFRFFIAWIGGRALHTWISGGQRTARRHGCGCESRRCGREPVRIVGREPGRLRSPCRGRQRWPSSRDRRGISIRSPERHGRVAGQALRTWIDSPGHRDVEDDFRLGQSPIPECAASENADRHVFWRRPTLSRIAG